MQVRGRYLVFAWTAVFFGAVGSIVLRTRAGFLTAHRVSTLEAQIRILESSRAAITADLAERKGRAALVPKAEAIGLRFTPDSDLVILPASGKP
jgi:hypothetical protein